MTERHYGNDVPTGPIPVIPPQDRTDAPVSEGSPTIPAQRRTSTTGGSSGPVGEGRSSRRRWLWVLLALVIVLCVAAVIVFGLVGTALAAVPSSGAWSAASTSVLTSR